jgi:prephenate dehydrogenase
MKNKKDKIAIIGFGRFGKLLAKLLSPYGEVSIISRKRLENCKFPQIKYTDLRDFDIVIPTVPISKFAKILEKINPFLKSGSIVMDVCSVKVIPCQQMKKIIRKDIELLGTHPMFGPDSAGKSCAGLQIIVCPLRISDKNLNKILRIFRDLKLKIINTTPANHDKQAAKSLSLVHFVGRGLSGAGIKDQEISTLGFDRLLAVNETVSNDTWELFLDMQVFNPYSKKIRQKFIDSLDNLHKRIEKEGENV